MALPEQQRWKERKTVTHLTQTQVHEGNIVDHRPSHANDHQCTSSSYYKGSSNNTAFNTRTLKHSLGSPILGVSKQFSNLLGIILVTQVSLYLISLTFGHQLFGKGKALGFEVGDD
jgi:hypothetical protein